MRNRIYITSIYEPTIESISFSIIILTSESSNVTIGSAELIYDLSDISRVYHWKENWKKGEYKNIIMWKVRLFDANDPLTSLYIYINAFNGEIIGAGSISD